MEARELIGLDIGQKRTGLARASSIARVAEPLMTVETEQLIEKLYGVIQEYQPEILVVGLPRNLRGEDTEQTKWVRSLTRGLQQRFPDVAFKFQDEALTTVAAAERLAKNATEIDSMAASIILQDFLDQQSRDKAEE